MATSGAGNLHIIEGIINKHVYVNIPPEHLKTCAENLGIQEHFAFTMTMAKTFSTFGACTVG